MEKKEVIPMKLINLEDGFHLMVSAYIGFYEVNLLVDTGASHTCFDKERLLMIPGIDEYDIEVIDKSGTGLGTNTMESAITHLEDLTLGNFMMDDYPVIVINMSHINESYALLDIPPIDGVIGSEYLKYFNAVIDYKNLELILTQPED